VQLAADALAFFFCTRSRWPESSAMRCVALHAARRYAGALNGQGGAVANGAHEFAFGWQPIRKAWEKPITSTPMVCRRPSAARPTKNFALLRNDPDAANLFRVGVQDHAGSPLPAILRKTRAHFHPEIRRQFRVQTHGRRNSHAPLSASGKRMIHGPLGNVCVVNVQTFWQQHA